MTRKYLDWLAKELHVYQPSDWYHIGIHKIKELNGGPLITMYSGWTNVLATYYPEHPWDFTHAPIASRSQEILYKARLQYSENFLISLRRCSPYYHWIRRLGCVIGIQRSDILAKKRLAWNWTYSFLH
jgi:hypothetical protein